MDIHKLLQIAKVPTDLHSVAEDAIELADRRSDGLFWYKLKTRLFYNKKIAKKLSWSNNRLIEVCPDWADMDIAPMLNITCNGDDGSWEDTPEGGRPIEAFYTNPDPSSSEYYQALHSKYAKGKYHPRSEKFRAMWYRRNGGEFKAYRLGVPVDTATGNIIYEGSKDNWQVKVYNSGDAWLIKAKRKIGFFYLNYRVGFETDNVFSGPLAPQMWYPIPGYELLAPVTWSILPSFK